MAITTVSMTIEAQFEGDVYRSPDGNYNEDCVDNIDWQSIWIDGVEFSETELIAEFGIQGKKAIVARLENAIEEWF